MSENAKRKSARTKLSAMGYGNCGGHFAEGGHVKGDKAAADVHKHESHLHPGKPKTKLSDGGCAEGGGVKPRADRLARGGKPHKGKKGHTTVNVVVGSQHPQPVPVPVPKPVPVPVDPSMAGGPPPGIGAPPGGPAGLPLPPPGGPQGLKRGGKVKMDSQRDSIKGIPDGQFKRGGRTKAYPIKDGAGGGLGRIQKAKEYGA